MSTRLVMLYQEMSAHTSPECAASCRVPHSCCSSEYCEMVPERARELGQAVPEPTGHPTIPYMSPTGCIVAPELRPICTLHTCAINGAGFKSGDGKWNKKYFELREQIENLEWERISDDRRS